MSQLVKDGTMSRGTIGLGNRRELEVALVLLNPFVRLLHGSVGRYQQLMEEERRNEETLLSLLDVQSRLLQNLEMTMEQKIKPGEYLVQLNEFVMFPPLAILSTYPRIIDDTTIVHQSAINVVIERAAIFLAVYSRSTKWTQDQACRAWQASLLALRSTAASSKQTTLDDRSSCTSALLKCIETVSSLTDPRCITKEEETLSLLLRETTIKLTSLLSHKPSLDTIELLDRLLHHFEAYIETWRTLLPVFVPLYGLILGQVRGEQKAIIGERSIRSICRLLEITCRGIQRSDQDVANNLLAQFKSPVSSMTELDSSTSTQRDSSDGDDGKRESAFAEEVRSRLTAPMKVLLHMLQTSRSSKVAGALQQLCKVILVDMKGVWDSDSGIKTSAAEYCIAVQCHLDIVKEQYNDVNTSRLRELLEEIPTLCHSQRLTELRSKLRLVRGYMKLIQKLRNSVDEAFRKACVALFDIDFNRVGNSPVFLVDDMSLESLSNGRDFHHHWYSQQKETMEVAMEMVDAFAQSLGSKRVFLLVDDWLADLYESCVKNAEHGLHITGTGQQSWVHQWISAVPVAHRMIQAILPVMAKDRKHHRRFQSFARAIIPVVTAAPLWTLPTIIRDAVESRNLHKKDMLLTNEAQSSVEHIASLTLRGNAALSISLIQLVRVLLEGLGRDSESYLSVVLYPLVERAATGNLAEVQQAALDTMGTLCQVCGSENLESFLLANSDYIFGSLNTKLQVSNEGSFPTQELEIAMFVLRRFRSPDLHHEDPPITRDLLLMTNVAVVVEALNRFTAHWDKWIQGKTGTETEVFLTRELCLAFRLALCFCLSSFGFDPTQSFPRESDRPESYLELLRPFQESRSCAIDQQNDEESRSAAMDITTAEIDLVSLSCARCSYALAMSDLGVQGAAVEALETAFRILSYAARYYKNQNPDAVNTHETAVLRQINTTWPAILAKVQIHRKAFSELMTPLSPSIVLLGQGQPSRMTIGAKRPSATSIPFLRQLLSFIATMVESSGDFAVSRIEKDLWPEFTSIVEVFLRHKTRVGASSANRNYEETKLLKACLSFLERLFDSSQAGRRLSSMIPSAGTLILPFLDDEVEDIRQCAVLALQSMLRIDCDSLLRPLYALSGLPLPLSPFEMSSLLEPRSAPSLIMEASSNNFVIMQQQATGLIQYANALPEQQL